MDSLSPPNHPESSQTLFNTDINNEENQDNERSREASLGDENQISMSEADLKGSDTIKEQDEDSLVDGDTATPSINRFAILSEDQQTKDVTSDDDKGDVYDEREEDLVKEMDNVTLDDDFIEDPDALEHPPETEDEPKEVKEYTVVNQDPKLAFHTLGSRTAPERQECSVQSCLFRFTEVETLTQNNSLLCVTCTQQQPKKDKG